MPCDDDAFGPGRIREDGRKLHPAYLLEVKKPEESRGSWDYYKPLQTTPADEAFRPGTRSSGVVLTGRSRGRCAGTA